MSDTFLVGQNDLVGAVARYAVLQSPYPVPDDLETALRKFAELLKSDPAFKNPVIDVPLVKTPVAEFHRWYEIVELLDRTLFTLPEVQRWNERKNGEQGHAFVSIHEGRPDPDDDFVDLDALARNVAMLVARDNDDSSAEPVEAEA